MKYKIEVEDSILASYISPGAMQSDVIEMFQELGRISPYELKFQELDWWLDRCHERKERGMSELEEFKRAECEYREFVTLHGQRVIPASK